jgi:spermidine/putrescine transport system ATP-binding protein
MIGGFEQPTSGLVELRGHDVTTDPPDKRPINMVFQNYALFPHLDVGENVAFGLKRKHVAKDEITRRTGEVLELVHLAGYERRKPNQLSGGQQQRVALARALVNRPNVLLLDEPLGALDLKLRKALQVELKRIQQEVGITFVYVTHDQEEALTMSDRIAVMNRGRVEQLGSPEELYDRPTTRFVADFIGTTNLLHGTVEALEDGFALVRLDSGDRCRIGRDGRASGQEVDISVRPEAIAILADHGSAGANGALSATIQQSAYLGSAVQYIVRTTGGVALTVLTAKNAERLTAEQAVVLDWPPDEALVLGDRPVELEDTG